LVAARHDALGADASERLTPFTALNAKPVRNPPFAAFDVLVSEIASVPVPEPR
jgi:hypothetical protein